MHCSSSRPRFSAPRLLGVAILWSALVATGTSLAQRNATPSGQVDLTAVRSAVGEPEGPSLQGEELDRRTYELSDLLRCPVCQGLSVAASPAPTALAMREEVRHLLSIGYSEDQVTRYFESAYGEFVRLAPKAEGFNLVVWLAPLAFLAAGLLVAVMRSRPTGTRNDTASTAPAAVEVDAELEAHLERVRREVAAGKTEGESA